jgi:hypothetical protein
MNFNLPFHTASVEKPGAEIYHTHPQCRIALQIAPSSRVNGIGDGRTECPFCFVLGQLRSHNKLVDMPGTPIPASSASHGQGELATTAHGGQALAQ